MGLHEQVKKFGSHAGTLGTGRGAMDWAARSSFREEFEVVM